MASWVVLEPPANATHSETEFVRDSFRWVALFVPPLWLLWHRLWPEALLTLAALAGINALAASGAVSPSIGMLSTLVGIYVALEGPALRIASLQRRGYQVAAAFIARDMDEAEIRYGAAHELDESGPWEVPPPLPGESNAAARKHAPALGLFTYPGRS